jgi:hypothetical protein
MEATEATDATQRKKPIVTLQRTKVRGEPRFVVYSRILGVKKREYFRTQVEARIYHAAILDKLESRGTESFNAAPGMTS